ncbi:MAG: hypothetical protein AAF446_02010, partial [Pseudomonadota bacterium]
DAEVVFGAGAGGFISLTGGSFLTIAGSTISNNSAIFAGGLVIDSNDSTLDIFNTTISGNSAQQEFGGVTFRLEDSSGSINFSTITDNTAGTETGGFNFFPTMAMLSLISTQPSLPIISRRKYPKQILISAILPKMFCSNFPTA